MADIISYHAPTVSGFAADTGARAGQLEAIHADTAQLTNALAEFFAGHGAMEFFDAQNQMLSGLQGLVDTVRQHGLTTGHVLDAAIATDNHMRGLFA